MNAYCLEDLFVGMKESFETQITQKLMDLFSEVSGDNNPLHLDEAYAKSQGFNDRVAYGLLTTSFYSRLAGVHLPGKYCLLHSIETTFLKPAYIGDRLLVSGEISHINEAFGQVELKASIFQINGGGELIKISKAKIKLGVLQCNKM